MKIHNNAVSGKIILIILLFIITNSSLSIAQEKTLYQRLGGYNAIAAVTDDFLTQLATDPSMGVFFKGTAKIQLKKSGCILLILFVMRPAALAHIQAEI